jgi:sporulation protein YlmC with PRC-barrel domain
MGRSGLDKLFKQRMAIRSQGCRMLEEASELIGLQVYTSQGIFLGSIGNLVVDVDENKVQGLFVTSTNPLLVEGSKSVNVPYRWISSIGDIVILKYFPKRVAVKRSSKPKTERPPAED